MSKLLVNPYKPGPPIKGNDFYGRSELLNQVLQELRRSNVILLQGQRRIGKSSFLHQMNVILKNEEFLPVLFDIQRYVNDTFPQFQEHLALAIANELQLPVPNSAEFESKSAMFTEIWLPKVFKNLDNKQIVLLVDEFDNLGEQRDNKAIEVLVPFIGNLVANEPQLKWVFVVGRQIGKLPIQYDPIVSQAIKLTLGRLTKEETKDLIVRPAEGTLLYQPEAVRRIFQLTSGQPHLTQAICSKLFERVVFEGARNAVSINDVEAVLIPTLDAWAGAIASIARVPPIEERVLSAVSQLSVKGKTATREDIIRLLTEYHISLEIAELDNTLNRLAEWDLLMRTSPGGWKPTIELMQIWVNKNISLELSREKEIDFVSARAQNYYEFAEKARSVGNYDYAIKDYLEVLNLIPMHQPALRGLAEAYRITNNLEGITNTLQKLYRLDRTVLPKLIESMADYAQMSEKLGDIDVAAEQYFALIKIQDNRLWQEGLSRILMLKADKILKAEKKNISDLEEIRHAFEAGLAVVSISLKLKTKLEEVKQAEWTLSMQLKAEAAMKQRDWKNYAKILLALQNANVELSISEKKALMNAAYQSLYFQSSPLYRWTKWTESDFNNQFAAKIFIGCVIGIFEALIFVSLMSEVAGWGPMIFTILVVLNIGFINSIASKYKMRVLTNYLLVGIMATGLIWLLKSYTEYVEFPPSSITAYYLLAISVSIPLSFLNIFGNFNIGKGLFNGLVLLIVSWIGAVFGKFIGTEMINLLPLPAATGIGLSIAFIYTYMMPSITFESIDDTYIEEAKCILNG